MTYSLPLGHHQASLQQCATLIRELTQPDWCRKWTCLVYLFQCQLQQYHFQDPVRKEVGGKWQPHNLYHKDRNKIHSAFSSHFSLKAGIVIHSFSLITICIPCLASPSEKNGRYSRKLTFLMFDSPLFLLKGANWKSGLPLDICQWL